MRSKLAQILVPDTNFPPFSVPMTLLFRPLGKISAAHTKKVKCPPPGFRLNIKLQCECKKSNCTVNSFDHNSKGNPYSKNNTS